MVRPSSPKRGRGERAPRARALGIAWAAPSLFCPALARGELPGGGQPLAELTGGRVRRTFDDVEVADISLEDYIAVKVRATAR